MVDMQWLVGVVTLSLWLNHVVTLADVVDNNSDRSNVLFIIYDDLRPELSIYGKPHMITPNFDRLAKKSVTFDLAFCQVAVCNPSRDSLLTGLRPDTTGTHGFQHSFRPNMIFPTYLAKNNYSTVGFGKILHWDGPDDTIWTDEYDDGGWKKLTQRERKYMNATTTPDKIKPETEFLDYKITTKLISAIERLHIDQINNNEKHFLAAIGFKLPHVPVHIPYKYFDMYRHRLSSFDRRESELSFPPTSPLVAHKCCASMKFTYMKNEGATKSKNSINLNGHKPTFSFKPKVYKEIMWGYAAAVSYLDMQLGRILDLLDRLDLWKNMTIILTSDHGMHNGEKGIWEKWTLFDESTHVPLLISHPSSPMQGYHYPFPVELVDIFPTLVSLLQLPSPSENTCSGDMNGINRCLPLEGTSLSPILSGSLYDVDNRKWLKPRLESDNSASTKLLGVAISQAWRCAKKIDLTKSKTSLIYAVKNPWFDCNVDSPPNVVRNERSVMGYSFRTAEFRYTMWLVAERSRARVIPLIATAPLYEELYDHRTDNATVESSFELTNLASVSSLMDRKNITGVHDMISTRRILQDFRRKYLSYLHAVHNWKS